MTGNPELIDQYREIHASRVYGATSVKNLRFLRPEIRLLRPQSILDYGCGQSRLLEALELGYPVERRRYDPAIPDYAEKPSAPADLLINVDVLEHIEEADLDTVLAEMRALCREAIIIVDTKPAKAVLPDGRNAHVTLRPRAWWQAKISEHFGPLSPIATVRSSRAGFKTWRRTPVETLRYALMRAAETAVYYLQRLAGRRPQDRIARTR